MSKLRQVLKLYCQGQSKLQISNITGKRSTLFTSQVPVSQWYEVIGEQTIADAILDRIIHDAHRLELRGESMRKKRGILVEENKENED